MVTLIALVVVINVLGNGLQWFAGEFLLPADYLNPPLEVNNFTLDAHENLLKSPKILFQ